MSIKLSPKQTEIFEEIMHFILEGDESAYVFSGVAGSGKSVIIDKIQADLKLIGLRSHIIAFTGRAVSSLINKGAESVGTIHSLLYFPVIDEKTKEIIGWNYVSKEEIRASYDVIIVEEGGMVSEKLFEDIMEIGVPTVFVGDKEQLPPIDDNGFNVMDAAQAHLTEIHRQAEGNPIITLSRQIREYGFFRKKHLEGIKQITRQQLTRQYMEKNPTDMIICGTNATRKKMNELYRYANGFYESFPEVGERLMGLQNKRTSSEAMIYNGGLYIVEGVGGKTFGGRDVIVKNEHGSLFTCVIGLDEWESGSVPSRESVYSHFDYGYAATCHKCQGSQFNHVTFIKEDVSWFVDQRKFDYTAVTRAVKDLTVVL